MKLHCKWCHEEVKVGSRDVVEVKCGRCAMRYADYIMQEKDKMELERCFHHPGYRVIAPPNGDCKTCWKLWNEKMG